MIIGLLGFIDSGKNTVGKYIVEKYGFEQLSFAGSLKDCVAVMFNWDRKLLEGDTKESRIWREQVDEYWSKKLGWIVTPRKVLQLMGTEAGRNIFGKNIWVASTLKKVYNNKNYIITDCRFKNECDAIKEENAVLLWVRRGELPEWYDTALNNPELMETRFPDIHESEWDWIGTKVDHTIKNNGTLETLYQQIDNYLEGIKT